MTGGQGSGILAISTRLIRPYLRTKVTNLHRNQILLFFELYVNTGTYVLYLNNSLLLLSSGLLLRHLYFMAFRMKILTRSVWQDFRGIKA